jgi:hypothetical protein
MIDNLCQIGLFLRARQGIRGSTRICTGRLGEMRGDRVYGVYANQQLGYLRSNWLISDASKRAARD